jgi:hypothetical protein
MWSWMNLCYIYDFFSFVLGRRLVSSSEYQVWRSTVCNSAKIPRSDRPLRRPVIPISEYPLCMCWNSNFIPILYICPLRPALCLSVRSSSCQAPRITVVLNHRYDINMMHSNTLILCVEPIIGDAITYLQRSTKSRTPNRTLRIKFQGCAWRSRTTH